MSQITKKIVYPQTPRSTTTYTRFNRIIHDPYRPLESPNTNETKQFIEQQNQITNKYLEEFKHTAEFKESLTRAFDYQRFGAPYQVGKGENVKWFYSKNDGLKNQNILYRLSGPEKTATETIFFDPNTLSEDGTVALSPYTTAFSEDGKYYAYGLSYQGSDWLDVHIRDVETGETREILKWVKFSGINWTYDNKGFFYSRYPEPKIDGPNGTETDVNLNAKLYYHLIGTPQSEDQLICYDESKPSYLYGCTVSHDGKYLVVSVSKDTDPQNLLWIAKLPDGPIVASSLSFNKLVDHFADSYTYLHNVGKTFYFETNKDAPKGRVISTDIDTSPLVWKEVLAESKDVLESIDVVANGKYWVTKYLADVKSTLQIRSFDDPTNSREVPIDIGSVVSISCRDDSDKVFLKFSSFLVPGTVYQLDLEKAQALAWRSSGEEIPGFKVRQEWATSKDGTRVPMFVIGGSNEFGLIYGYGGFGHAMSPMFSPTWLTILKHTKGTVIVSCLRGGGEYGREWHQAGTRTKKLNVFDDFAACAKHVTDNDIVQKGRLVCNGGSNGGLLVAATLNMYGPLFAGGIADVGVLDMLRFHLFTIGHAWQGDYGHPDDNEEEFNYLANYSPVHNVNTKQIYPPLMCCTSDHDDRVSPLHSFKYVAALQYEAQGGPFLLQHHLNAGHGAGKPTSKVIAENAEKFAFYMLATKANYYP